MIHDELIRKYDVPVPRYTSYPTVPCWDTNGFSTSAWWQSVDRAFRETNREKGISLYVHLPFCESLCTYCACNTRITKNHAVEDRYLNALLNEWDIYKNIFSEMPVIREIHLGGGTPTFFSAANLSLLVGSLLNGASIHSSYEFSFEGHPNNTSAQHLQLLYDRGFRRVSYGVQDLDNKVQKAINRIQPFENLERAVKESREIGYKSVSFDLIYGLPYQTIQSVRSTIEKVLQLAPDRIAFYSYAHVPWIKPGQRGYEDADLPSDVMKRALYDEGRKLFLDAGYVDVGMDHFALPSDSLAQASQAGTLHRNFMGYTTNPTELLIGLGASSISDAKYAYAQNEKKVETYEERIKAGHSAFLKGHIQTAEDLGRRKAILDIVCKGQLDMSSIEVTVDKETLIRLQEMEMEGIVNVNAGKLTVTDNGRAFIRNIASLFDERMYMAKAAAGPLFSKAI